MSIEPGNGIHACSLVINVEMADDVGCDGFAWAAARDPSFVSSSSTPPRSADQAPELLNVWISTHPRWSSWPTPPSTRARRSSAGSATSLATMRSPGRESSVFCHPGRAKRNPNHRFRCRSRYVLLCFHFGCHASHRRSSNQRMPPLWLPQHALVHSARSIGRRRDTPVRSLQSRDNDPGGRRTHSPGMAQPVGRPRRVGGQRTRASRWETTDSTP
jgi:hypothetical protein